MFLSLLLIAGSYIATAQKFEIQEEISRDAELGPITLYGTPVKYTNGTIYCGPNPGLCATIQKIASPSNSEEDIFSLKVFSNGSKSVPFEFEAKRIEIQNDGKKAIVKFQ